MLDESPGSDNAVPRVLLDEIKGIVQPLIEAPAPTFNTLPAFLEIQDSLLAARAAVPRGEHDIGVLRDDLPPPAVVFEAAVATVVADLATVLRPFDIVQRHKAGPEFERKVERDAGAEEIAAQARRTLAALKELAGAHEAGDFALVSLPGIKLDLNRLIEQALRSVIEAGWIARLGKALAAAIGLARSVAVNLRAAIQRLANAFFAEAHSLIAKLRAWLEAIDAPASALPPDLPLPSEAEPTLPPPVPPDPMIMALEREVANTRKALDAIDQREEPYIWAATQNELGRTLSRLALVESETDRWYDALTAYRAALEGLSRERMPLDWAMAQRNVADTLCELGAWEESSKLLMEGVVAYRVALEEQTRERSLFDWATTQNNLGSALLSLAEIEGGTDRLEEAVKAFQAAAGVFQHGMAGWWAMTQVNVGLALLALAERESGTGRIEQAIAVTRAAMEVLTPEEYQWDRATESLERANALLEARRRGG
ncbi:MAG: hypothetical protein HQL41_19825 [Alphaproteobacteria bacterium]|nr:hypothetical protein [Alphaproteobacteria bacterium]